MAAASLLRASLEAVTLALYPLKGATVVVWWGNATARECTATHNITENAQPRIHTSVERLYSPASTRLMQCTHAVYSCSVLCACPS